MVTTPTGADSEVQVAIGADTDEFNGAMDEAIATLTNFNKKSLAVAAGGVAALAGAIGVKAVDAAAEFESAMADVEKVTSEATADELTDDMQELAEEIPLSTEALAGLAAQAGRFGVEGPENIRRFTRVAGEMGAATTLSADEAGRALAKVATAVGEPVENVRELGDSINELSNNFATNSAEIVDTTQRAGFALEDLGLKSDEILGLAAAMNEVAPTSRRAATMLRLVSEAVASPKNVSEFARLLGVTEEEFKRLRAERPEELMLQISRAMGENTEASKELSRQLSTSQARAFDRLAGRSDELKEALSTSNEAMEEGGSLSREVSIETDTLSAKMGLLKDDIKNVFIELGSNLTPAIKDVVERIREFINSGGDLSEMLSTDLKAAIKDLAGEAATAARDLVTALIGPDGESGALTEMVDRGTNWLRDRAPKLIGDAMKAIGGGIRRALIDMTNPLRGEDSAIWDMIADAATWLAKNTPRIMFRVGQAIVKGIIDGVKGLFEGLVGNSVLKDQIIEAGTWLVNNMGSLMANVGQSIVDAIASGIKEAPGKIKEAIENIVEEGIENVTDGDGIDVPDEEEARETAEEDPRIDVPGGVGDDDDDIATGPKSDLDDDKDRDPDRGERVTIPDNMSGRNPFGLGRGRTDIVAHGVVDGAQSGGFLERGGMTMLHEGERVLPASQVTDRGEAELDTDELVGEVRALRQTIESGPDRVRERDVAQGLARLLDRQGVSL